MADHFSRPLRLTRIEALAITCEARSCSRHPGCPDAPALAKALEKLRTSLGEDALRAADGRIEIARGGPAPEHLDVLRAAAGSHDRLEDRVLRGVDGEWSRREIDPEEVFSGMGQWYVAAWDVDADAERLFRADRVRSAVRTGETFAPRGLEGRGARPLLADRRGGRRPSPSATGRQVDRGVLRDDAGEGVGGRRPGRDAARPTAGVGGALAAPRRGRRGGDRALDLRDDVRRLARDTLARYGHKT